jgi:hypothetical protein
MKITKQELIDLDACKSGLNRFIKQTNDTNEPVEIASLVGGENTIGDLTWLAIKICDKQDLIKFSCKCALINVELIKPYTDKYDLIVGFLNNPSNGDADAARDACSDVRAAARADNDAVTLINEESKVLVNQYLKELFAK